MRAAGIGRCVRRLIDSIKRVVNGRDFNAMYAARGAHEFPTIKGARRRDETTLRLGGIGDNWHMSWAADDRQVVAMCDGYGWPSTARQSYNSRLYRITGSPPGVHFEDVPGYPELLSDTKTPGGFSRYYGFGTLAIDGRIYQFLSTPNVPFDQPGPRFVGAKLIYSGDDGATWRNQDGSSPVSWEAWPTRSKQNMVFFEESQEAFALLTILQMGRNYEYNSDGFVYVYAPNGNTDGTMNELAMFRVPRDRILSRGAYEYFAGTRDSGPVWTADIDARGIVCSFPRGWVNTTIHPYSWQPSVAYNQPLGVYMMANWGMGCAEDGSWFGKPSYLGLWVAPDPWAPGSRFTKRQPGPLVTTRVRAPTSRRSRRSGSLLTARPSGWSGRTSRKTPARSRRAGRASRPRSAPRSRKPATGRRCCGLTTLSTCNASTWKSAEQARGEGLHGDASGTDHGAGAGGEGTH